MIIEGFSENMMLLWTIGFVHTSTHRSQLLQSGLVVVCKLSHLPETSESYYTNSARSSSVCKLLRVQADLTMCGAV